MAADFKSHILSRDEKGFGGVPFKRLLLGGVGGGLVYTVLRLALPNVAILGGLIAALALVILTAPRGGLPLWLRLWIGVRGRLLLSAAANPSGLTAELARLLRRSSGRGRGSRSARWASGHRVLTESFIRNAVLRDHGVVFDQQVAQQ